jgi:release factor glutamine methyltransferase
LLAHVLGLTRLRLYLEFDRPLVAEELARFRALFKRRLTHEPLQYILGETEFMGLPIDVDRHVLIPRPETEVLVEQAVSILRRRGGDVSGTVVDIGTGSGNIAVAVGHLVPDVKIFALDVSPDALKVAERNIRKNGVTNVALHQLDILRDPLPAGDYFMILSNPPYVPVEDFRGLEEEVRVFEPRIATTDEGDGLEFFRRIFEVAHCGLRADGWVLLEIGFGQSGPVHDIARQSRFRNVHVIPDLAGIPRVVCARKLA